MPLGVALNVAFVCVITLLRYLIFNFYPNGLGIPVLCQVSVRIQDRVKGKCLLLSTIRYLVYLLTGLNLAYKFHTWILIINCLWAFLPYSWSHISIFLFLKAISYPYIITIHYLCISLSIGLPWIDCWIYQICKMQLINQEKAELYLPIPRPFVLITFSPY